MIDAAARALYLNAHDQSAQAEAQDVWDEVLKAPELSPVKFILDHWRKQAKAALTAALG